MELTCGKCGTENVYEIIRFPARDTCIATCGECGAVLFKKNDTRDYHCLKCRKPGGEWKKPNPGTQ